MPRLLLAAIVVALSYSAAAAQDRRGTRLWNLTRYTLTSVQLSLPDRNAWGRNQCENDPDGTVDHNERLRITGIAAGSYDIRISDQSGRTCVVRNVDVVTGQIFSIEEKDLTDCGR